MTVKKGKLIQRIFLFLLLISLISTQFTVPAFAVEGYTVTVKANPISGGRVLGSGVYGAGAKVTISAKALPDYVFLNITDENGNEVSKEPIYIYEVSGDKIFQANFVKVSSGDTSSSTTNVSPAPAPTPTTSSPDDGLGGLDFTVNVVTNPKGAGEITGTRVNFPNDGNGGQVGDAFIIGCDSGETLTLKATSQYPFINWTTLDGKVVSDKQEYTFQATKGYLKLRANFDVPTAKTSTPTVTPKESKPAPEPVAVKGEVFGVVKDSDGKPLSGVNVELDSTVKTTSTDVEGKYSFKDIEIGNHKITITNPYTLEETSEIKATVRNGSDEATSTLTPSEKVDLGVDLTSDNKSKEVDIVIAKVEKPDTPAVPVVAPVDPPAPAKSSIHVVPIVVAVASSGLFWFLIAAFFYNVEIRSLNSKGRKGRVIGRRRIKEIEGNVLLNLSREALKTRRNSMQVKFSRTLLAKLQINKCTVQVIVDGQEVAVITDFSKKEFRIDI